MSALSRSPAELEAQRAPAEGERHPGARPASPLGTVQGMLGNRALRRWLAGGATLQMKSRGSPAGDPLELEADRQADAAARGPREAHAAAAPAAPPAQGSSGEGEALPPALRADMEAHFGRDFGAVRVHRGGAAQASARDLGARAFTSGAHVGFAQGEYAPEGSRGRWLVAHELAHVAQQGAAPSHGAGAAAPRAGARAVQLKVDDEQGRDKASSSPLVSKLKTDPGGLGTKVPLTRRMLSRLEALGAGGAGAKLTNPEAGAGAKKEKETPTEPDKPQQGVPFVWDPADEHAIDPSDVDQGSLGDCYFLALLAAIAAVRPDFIERMVKDNKDGTYTVIFFDDDGKEEKHIVTPEFPSYAWGPQYADFGDESGLVKEMWPMLIEKAWAQRLSKKTKLGHEDWQKIRGSRQEDTTEYGRAVTGSKFEYFDLPDDLSDEELLDRLHEHFVVKRLPVTFRSHEKTDYWVKRKEVTGVVPNHGYPVVGVDKKQRTATLRNVHGPKYDLLEDKSMAFLRENLLDVRFFELAAPGAGRTKARKPTQEEQVAQEAVPKEILKQSGYDDLVHMFGLEIKAVDSAMGAHAVVLRYGELLWSRSKSRAQMSEEAETDDRPLYWARLQMAAILRGLAPKTFKLTPAEKDVLLDVLEATSRGRTDIAFAEEQKEAEEKGTKQEKDRNERRVVVSGFDPFGFQDGGSRRMSNPSGAAVLALDGETVPARAGKLFGRVEGVIFPVRFGEFDQGVVEKTFRPFLKTKYGVGKVDMLMTISQGGSHLGPEPPKGKGKKKEREKAMAELSKSFELEQYAGRSRSPSKDNAGATGGQPGAARGGSKESREEFHESSLPRKEIHAALGREETEEESNLTYRRGKDPEEVVRPSGGVPTEDQAQAKAVEGSGGGYLSNEIFYRTAALRIEEGSEVPVGHLHVPNPNRTKEGKETTEDVRKSLRDRIVKWVRRIIAAALPHIGKKKKTP